MVYWDLIFIQNSRTYIDFPDIQFFVFIFKTTYAVFNFKFRMSKVFLQVTIDICDYEFWIQNRNHSSVTPFIIVSDIFVIFALYCTPSVPKFIWGFQIWHNGVSWLLCYVLCNYNRTQSKNQLIPHAIFRNPK